MPDFPDTSYSTIQSKQTTVYTAKDSRFIATLLPAKDPEAAIEAVARLKLHFSTASHNCWAFRIGAGDRTIYRCDDDGEPAGTAGKPILQALETRNVSDVLLLVTRYFGGSKLGIGGLIRAYSGAAFLILSEAELLKVEKQDILIFTISYPQLNIVKSVLQQQGARILDTNFKQDIYLKVSVPEARSAFVKQELMDLTKGKIVFQRNEKSS